MGPTRRRKKYVKPEVTWGYLAKAVKTAYPSMANMTEKMMSSRVRYLFQEEPMKLEKGKQMKVVEKQVV